MSDSGDSVQSVDLRVGIIGGGQLAQMLFDEAGVDVGNWHQANRCMVVVGIDGVFSKL